MKARPTQSRKGVKGQLPLAGSRDSVPCGVWGNAPTVPRPTNPKEAANKGAGSEASLPLTLRVRRRAPKLLFPQDSVKNLLFALLHGRAEGFAGGYEPKTPLMTGRGKRKNAEKTGICGDFPKNAQKESKNPQKNSFWGLTNCRNGCILKKSPAGHARDTGTTGCSAVW